MFPLIQGNYRGSDTAQLSGRFESLSHFDHQPSAPRADKKLVPSRFQYRPHKEIGQAVRVGEAGPAVSLVMVQPGSFSANPGVAFWPDHKRQHRPSLPAIWRVKHFDFPRPQDIEAAASANPDVSLMVFADRPDPRSEERRVGKECRSRWS